MSAQLTFWYKRREQVKGKDGTTLIIECEDCINLYDVLRGFWRDDTTFVLQMKDAHEESRYPDLPHKVVEEMKRANKLPPKERQWVLSYVELHGLDIFRFRTATELQIPSEVGQLTKVQHPFALNPPKVVVDQPEAANPLSVVKDEPSEEIPSALPPLDLGDPIDPAAHIEENDTIEV